MSFQIEYFGCNSDKGKIITIKEQTNNIIWWFDIISEIYKIKIMIICYEYVFDILNKIIFHILFWIKLDIKI